MKCTKVVELYNVLQVNKYLEGGYRLLAVVSVKDGFLYSLGQYK